MELEDEIDAVHYYTDSTTVLNYLKNAQLRLPVFVANRVQTIKEYSQPDQWSYVDTKHNPADKASRGMSIHQLIEENVWISGPEFLWTHEDDWPKPSIDINAETSNAITTNGIANEPEDAGSPDDPTTKLMEHYSQWPRLVRAVGVFLKLKKILLNRVKKTKGETEAHLASQNDLELEAETAILKWTQANHFREELQILKGLDRTQGRERKQVLKKKSTLWRLDPFLDSDIIRVGGRLSRAKMLSFNAKHQIVLPNKSHVTSLLVQQVHQQLGHSGRNHTISELQTKYWIIQGNKAVRRELSKCVTCRKLYAMPCEQKMADLPADRLHPAPPFTFTAVDYFGPFIVKEKRKELKRYGVLFTCLLSRAVHVETSNSLDTDSFLNALRRFTARRGQVKELRSDNGTNFIGAERELQKSLQEMDQDQIKKHLQEKGMTWTFNPPYASHMGGVWERQIRTVRKILAALLMEYGSHIDDEALRTLLCEVEAIINSRPLTCLPNHPDDLSPLTSQQILTLKESAYLPLPGTFDRNDVYARRRWRRVQYLSNLFWSRWRKEYLATLQHRQKWTTVKRNLKVGDVVLLKDDNAPRNAWNLGRVTETESDKNDLVRSVSVKTQKSCLRRPVTKIVLLIPSD